jgi:CRISPR-associated exonuclease Cas4
MHDEDTLLPLSALQHLRFCRRQCALIHLEQAWAENRLTVEGRVLHERVHEQGGERRGDLKVERGLSLRSLRLGLTGVADVVEFRRDGVTGLWRPFPVEYKRGRPKTDGCDEVQLCAQALCLEEMLATAVPAGALYYGQSKRRRDVAFTAELRHATEAAAAELHTLLDAGITPPPETGEKCRACSLRDLCLPDAVAVRSAQRYLEHALGKGA